MLENILKNQNSQYLRQHMNDPVAWQPYNDEIFNLAKKLDRPIFLSIGYSACHWCHVMAHESFAREETAKILNEKFVPVKMDREEFPDVDKKYQFYNQVTSKQGGWPLSVFLMPDGKPFYGGTYFPFESNYGMPGFIDVLEKIHETYTNDRDNTLEVVANYDDFVENFISKRFGREHLPAEKAQKYFGNFMQNADMNLGGFGDSNKFPNIPNLMYLCEFYEQDEQVKIFLIKTAEAMCFGGIHDHINGGFYRYTVEKEWKIPHFEKMLYDNALIPIFLTKMYELTENNTYLHVARKTIDFILNEFMTEFGLLTSIDADSANLNGKMDEGFYYKLLEQDISELTEEEKELFNKFVYPHSGVAYVQGAGYEDYLKLEPIFEKISAKAKTYKPQPGRDLKVIASQNALFAKTLIYFYEVYGNEFYHEQANSLLNKIRHFHVNEDMIYRVNYNGELLTHSTLEDYAFLADALLNYFEISKEKQFMVSAFGLMEVAIAEFYRDGVLYLDRDHTSFESFDDALFSASGLMFYNLCKYKELMQNVPFAEIEDYMSDRILKFPTGHPTALRGMLLLD